MENGDMHLIYVPQRFIHTPMVNLELAKQLTKLLSDSREIFRFVNDQYTKMSGGAPQSNFYYNMACILPLLVELEHFILSMVISLVREEEERTATLLIHRKARGARLSKWHNDAKQQSFLSKTCETGALLHSGRLE
jgi:hypothetical protein